MTWYCPRCLCRVESKSAGFCIQCGENYLQLTKKAIADQAKAVSDRQKVRSGDKVESRKEPRGPKSDLGCPNCPNDRLDGSFDNAAGRGFDTKAERKAFYKANKLQRMSLAEAKRYTGALDHDCMEKSISFSGQTRHKVIRKKT